MRTAVTPHLTDDQFTECMLTEPNEASRQHLASCELCRAELAVFGSSVNDFGKASAAWSESASRVSIRALAKTNARRTGFVAAGWALTAAVLLAIGLPQWMHRRTVPAGDQTAEIAALQDSASQIAQDDKLMQSVYVALAPQDPSPFQEYQLTDGHSSRRVSGSRTP
jgi:hypothetical protein